MVFWKRKKKKVLVVDDDAVTRTLARKALEEGGFKVDDAADGAEALETLRKDPKGYGLVVLDYRMPVLDGHGFLREVRTDKRFAKLPVVMLTAYSQGSDVIKAFEYHATDYIVKPFDYADLVKRVRKAFR